MNPMLHKLYLKYCSITFLLLLTSSLVMISSGCRSKITSKREAPSWKDQERDDYDSRRRRYQPRDRDDDDDDDDDKKDTTPKTPVVTPKPKDPVVKPKPKTPAPKKVTTPLYSYQEKSFVVSTRSVEVLWYSEADDNYKTTIGAKIESFARSLMRFTSSSKVTFVTTATAEWVDASSTVKAYDRTISATNILERITLATSPGGDFENFFSEEAFKAIIFTVNDDRPTRRRNFILHFKGKFSNLDDLRVYALHHVTETAANAIHSEYNDVVEEFGGLHLSLSANKIVGGTALCCKNQDSAWDDEILEEIRHYSLKNTFTVDHKVHSVTSATISDSTISARDISFSGSTITISRSALRAGSTLKLVYRTENTDDDDEDDDEDDDDEDDDEDDDDDE